MSNAIALDLGSSRLKAARLDGDTLRDSRSVAAPSLRGETPIREGDAAEYLHAALDLLKGIGDSSTPLGIATQRSTFVLWDRMTGEPIAPMVSWQDSRAAGWCRAHVQLQPTVFAATGLQLSAHYAGPKLAAMQIGDRELHRRLRRDDVLWGNLDTYLLWQASRGRIHETEPTMAARTAMLDLARGDWSDELLEAYDIPRRVLPRVRPTSQRAPLPLAGLAMTATLADQAAGALALLPASGNDVLINLGTGAFVMRCAVDALERSPGYLTAPIFAGDEPRHVVEAAIGGSGAAVDRYGRGPTELPVDDPTPKAFALPDAAGLGAPYWLPQLGLTFSTAAAALPAGEKRRIVLEGMLFRLKQVLAGLFPGKSPRRILVSGGLSRDDFVRRGLAALLQREIALVDAADAGLVGAANLALGCSVSGAPALTTVSPDGGGYLLDKYAAWSAWLDALIRRSP